MGVARSTSTSSSGNRFVACSWNSSRTSSYSQIDPPSSPASSVARETIVARTVSRFKVELTARPTSPSAFNSLTERVSSRVRASSSVNSRTFSIAITAWSAKVRSSAICEAGKGPGSGRPTAMPPIAFLSRISGTARMLRNRPAVARFPITGT